MGGGDGGEMGGNGGEMGGEMGREMGGEMGGETAVSKVLPTRASVKTRVWIPTPHIKHLHHSTSVMPEVAGGAEVGRSLELIVRDLASKIKWRSIAEYTQHQHLHALTHVCTTYKHVHTYTSHTRTHTCERSQLEGDINY